MNSDGTNPQPLVNDGYFNKNPNFSHDGTKITYSTNKNGSDDIYTINIDGTGETQITYFTNASENHPSFSPDNTKIAFNSNLDGDSEIYTINANGTGTGLQQLTHNSIEDGKPDWR